MRTGRVGYWTVVEGAAIDYMRASGVPASVVAIRKFENPELRPRYRSIAALCLKLKDLDEVSQCQKLKGMNKVRQNKVSQ